jgi:ABC-type branched-subunit amino acid transport system substrate-binding protein
VAQRIMINAFLWFAGTLSLLKANAQSVAVFYPKSGVQQDFFCMTDAVFNDAKAGGRELTWKLIDTENEATGIVRAASQLDKSKFTHLLGTRTSQEAIALSKFAEVNQLPFIAPIASHPDVTVGKKFTIRLVSTSSRYGELMKRFLIEAYPKESAAIVRNLSLPFSTFYADFMGKELSGSGKMGKVRVIDTFDGFSNYDDVARVIVTEKFKVVYAPVYTVEAVSLYNALSKLGFEGSIVSQGGITDGKEFFEKGAKENPKIRVFYNGIWSGKIEGPLSKKYRFLKKKFCSTQQDSIRTVSAFDAAMFLLAATSDAKLVGNSFVKIAKLTSFSGLIGPLRWGADGEPLRPLHVFQLQKAGPNYVGAFK